MSNEGSEFLPDSGGKEDYDSTITAAEFQQGEPRGGKPGGWVLVLTETADDGDTVERKYSVGGQDKGWASYDGGETITPPTRNTRFNELTQIYKFQQAVLQTEAREELFKRSKELYDGKGPFHAGMWVGLRFHWDAVPEKANRPDDHGEWHETEVTVVRPTRFLGLARKASQAPQAPQQQTPQLKPSNGGDISEADMAVLKDLARQHPDNGDFADAVMDRFPGDRAIIKAISKDAWITELRS